MFSQACVILFTGGECLPQCMLGDTPPPQQTPWSRHSLGVDAPQSRDTPLEQTPPREQTPPEQTPPWGGDPPREQTPPHCRACWEIWSTRGQYASYWNAILFVTKFGFLVEFGFLTRKSISIIRRQKSLPV